MAQNTFVTGESPSVVISVNGELFMRGWDRKEISALADHSNLLKVKQEGDTFNISCPGDCELSLPSAAVVQIERVGGEASISDLMGAMTILRVGGDLSLLRVGPVKVARVGGDFLVQQAGGELTLEKTGGDFTGREMGAAVLIDRAGGDITLQAVSGPVKAHASGDLRISYTTVAESALQAGGDLSVYLPSEAKVTLKITSHGGDIALDAGGRTESFEVTFQEVTLGEGGPVLELEAGGDVVVADKPWGENPMEDFGRGFADRGSRFDRMIADTVRRSMGDAEKIAARIARRSEDAARKAEQHVQSAMNRVEWSMGRRSRWDNIPGVPTPPPPPRTEPESKPVSDEERLMVLRMVQEKKISVEEAEKLLKALEGRHD